MKRASTHTTEHQSLSKYIQARFDECSRSQKDVAQYIVDRKSTRLNSSHVSISYAVFCLKKKNHRPGLFAWSRHVRPTPASFPLYPSLLSAGRPPAVRPPSLSPRLSAPRPPGPQPLLGTI